MANLVESGHSQGYLPPPDMREWVPEDDLSHFVREAVNRVAMEKFRVNERGTGSAQYHPRMMLGLLIHSYANGIFGSRRIERATHRDLGVRYVSGNRHPDHDTICKFRRENFAAVEEAFLEVLLLARELKLLRVGTVSVDGTKVDANANPRNSIRYDRAEALREVLREEIGELLGRAESADAEGAEDPQRLPGELSRREKPKSKLDRACAELRRRAEARAESERAEHERKVEARKGREGRRRGPRIKPPDGEPRAEEQINTTDADSALMRYTQEQAQRVPAGVQRAGGGGRGGKPAGAGGAGGHLRERPQRAGGRRGVGAGGGRGTGAGAGGQRLRDGIGGCRVAGPGCGGAGGDLGGGRSARARLPSGAAGEAGEGAEGGVDHRDEAQDGAGGEPGALPPAQTDRGTGVRDREGGDGIPALPAARPGEGGGGVGPGGACL